MRVPTIVPRVIENMSQEEIASLILPPEEEAALMREVSERFDRAIMDSVQQSSRAMDPDGVSGFNIDHIVGVGETMSEIARQVGVSAGMFGTALNRLGQAASHAAQFSEFERRQTRALAEAIRVPPQFMEPTPRAPPAKPKPVQPGASPTGKRKLNLGDD